MDFRADDDIELFSASSETDSVRWQGSQTSCAPLDSLIKEANSLQYRSLGNLDDLQTAPTSLLHATSSWPTSNDSRTVPRTSSSSHTRRHARHSVPLQVPDPALALSSLFNRHGADASQFIDLVRGVSERLNRDLAIERDGAAVGTKRKARSMSSDPADLDRRQGSEKKGRTTAADVDIKGKRKECYSGDTNALVSNRVGPLFPGVSTASKTTTGVGTSSTSEVGTFQSPINDSSTKLPTRRYTDMPPPPAPPPKPPPHNPQPPSMSLPQGELPQKPEIPIQQQSPPSLTPRLHPLLEQAKAQKLHTTSFTTNPTTVPRKISSDPPVLQNIPKSFSVSPQSRVQSRNHAQHPSASQSQPRGIPPPLGMRRIHTFPVGGADKPDNVRTRGAPSRQRGFKPPLLPSGSVRSSRLTDNARKAVADALADFTPRSEQVSQTSSSPNVKSEPQSSASIPFHPSPSDSCAPSKPVASPETETDGDADSSFGEVSFDLDALEETMRLYD